MRAVLRTMWAVLGVVAMTSGAASAADRWTIEYPHTTPEGLVGNGHSVVRVRPDGIDFHSGGDAHATFRLAIGDSVVALASPDAHATFFPGGVTYALTVRGVAVELTHGAFADVPWFMCAHVRGAKAPVALVIEATGTPALSAGGRVAIPCTKGAGAIAIAAGAAAPVADAAALRATLEAPYRTGLVLETPDAALDRAVPFSRALLDVGFDGRMHVCEIFRWRDVWSRDLGSGLVPGAMASGRFGAARTTIDYDLGRHAKADPLGLKVTQDPSQGGSAEGVAWLTRAVWRDYLLTGDREKLGAAARTLEPWVQAWLARDTDGRGLIVDVTEWMDHSRFFLFPDGARTLYSNALFAGLLRRFATIEETLGNPDAAGRYREDARRFDHGINTHLWNDAKGQYDNLTLWGRRDERTCSGENALAVLEGVASEARARRAMATVRAVDWRPAGSTTLYPPMTHVPEYIDHNYKVWPWWNAVEARARFRLDDRDAGVWLLDRCAATLEDVPYPGMMEELVSNDGKPEGGNAFLTAAGSYLDAIVEGLLGVEVVAPGCARLRVDPRTPLEWNDWRATVPLPQGELVLAMQAGVLHVRVTDPRVREIEVPEGAVVEGAAKVALAPRPFPAPADAPAPALAPPAAPHARRALVLAADGLPAPSIAPPAAPRVAATALDAIASPKTTALIVPGNAVPRKLGDTDVADALARFLDRGGSLVFWGATMTDRGTMGEHGGVIEWWEQRPVVDGDAIGNWRFRRSADAASIAPENEQGFREGWMNASVDESAWTPIAVPSTWEKALGTDFDGWGWYRAHFKLSANAKGRVVVLDLGRIDDDDWTFVNGVAVGHDRDWQAIRHYRIRPGDAAYATLAWGGANTLAVQVRDTGGGGGLWADTARAGIETSALAWSPLDPKSGEVAPAPVRHGVVSWGPGGRFFNSWETSRGAFGFAIEGRGVEFSGPLAGLPALDVDAREAFTDFATSQPWRFQPLAFTTTQRRILVPDLGERYPCAARLVNEVSGGEIVLVPASIARTDAAPRVLDALRLTVRP